MLQRNGVKVWCMLRIYLTVLRKNMGSVCNCVVKRVPTLFLKQSTHTWLVAIRHPQQKEFTNACKSCLKNYFYLINVLVLALIAINSSKNGRSDKDLLVLYKLVNAVFNDLCTQNVKLNSKYLWHADFNHASLGTFISLL